MSDRLCDYEPFIEFMMVNTDICHFLSDDSVRPMAEFNMPELVKLIEDYDAENKTGNSKYWGNSLFEDTWNTKVKKKSVKINVASVSNVAPVVAVEGPYTCGTNLYHYLKSVAVPGNAQANMGEAFKMLQDYCKFQSTDEAASYFQFMVTVLAQVHKPIDDINVDAQLAPITAKGNISGMFTKKTVYVSEPTLFPYLLTYGFECELVCDSQKPASMLTVPQMSDGVSYNVVVKCGDAYLEFRDGRIVGGDVDAFFSRWNTVSEVTRVLVPISAEVEKFARMLAGIYDYQYDTKEKRWVVTRSDAVKNSDQKYAALDEFAILVGQEMSRKTCDDTHYYAQFGAFCIAFKSLFDKCPTALLTSMVTFLFMEQQRAVSFALNTFSNDSKDALLSDVYKRANTARADRSKYRNVGFREALTKNLMDPALPGAPGVMCVSRKFMHLFARNEALYSKELDVYGCARMGFVDALVNNDFIKSEPGARNFYDVSNQFTGICKNQTIAVGDFYNIAKGSGEGKGIVDDVNSNAKYSSVIKHTITLDTGKKVNIDYKPNCMTYKLKIIDDAKYDAGVIKMMTNKMALPTALDSEILYPALAPLACYKSVFFDVPGKLQSGEFFISFSGREESYSSQRLVDMSRQYGKFLRQKLATMIYTNVVMNAVSLTNNKAFRKNMFTLRTLAAISSSPEYQKPGQERIREVWLARQVYGVSIREVIGVAKPSYGFQPVGAAYKRMQVVQKEDLLMDADPDWQNFVKVEDDGIEVLNDDPRMDGGEISDEGEEQDE